MLAAVLAALATLLVAALIVVVAFVVRSRHGDGFVTRRAGSKTAVHSIESVGVSSSMAEQAAASTTDRKSVV